jgi:hypothetical protein
MSERDTGVFELITVDAERTLKATLQEYEDLKTALEECSGRRSEFKVEYFDDKVFVFAPTFEERPEWGLPRTFLSQLGALIAKNGLEFLEFGMAFNCTGPYPNGTGGTYFRIRSDGSLWHPKLTW